MSTDFFGAGYFDSEFWAAAYFGPPPGESGFIQCAMTASATLSGTLTAAASAQTGSGGGAISTLPKRRLRHGVQSDRRIVEPVIGWMAARLSASGAMQAEATGVANMACAMTAGALLTASASADRTALVRDRDNSFWLLAA